MLKSLYLIPQTVNLCGTVGADIAERGQVVNASALFEYLYQKAFRTEIADCFALPGGDGIEDRNWLRIINRFTAYSHIVCDRLSCLTVIKAVNIFKARRRDFFNCFIPLNKRRRIPDRIYW